VKPRIIIYTDGSCSPNPGKGGWAAILISPGHNNRCREICGGELQTTNNRMEMTAAIEGLKALKRPCNVDLYTDSQYLRQAFEKDWIGRWLRNGWRTSQKMPVLNDDLWKILIDLTNIHSVAWKWVAGHASNAYNNRCDELAVQARLKIACVE
jgi:ribonuclease HI